MPSDEEPKTPAAFTDAAGRTWPLSISVGTLRACKAAGIDLAKAIGPRGDLPSLAADPEKFAALLWVLAAPEKKGVTEEDFAEALDGPALESAGSALVDAVADFTQPSRVAAISKRKAREARDEVIETAAKRMEALTFSNGPSDSPGLSESPPTPTPSAN